MGQNREAQKIEGIFWSPKRDAVKTFIGTVTSHALKPVVGRVTVVRSHRDIQTFLRGNILVSSMTAPEYITAMRKAKAVVTDAGGITSHAAIVSRELNIPCIVGTTSATRMLKNRDRVIVDTAKGVVQKLNA